MDNISQVIIGQLLRLEGKVDSINETLAAIRAAAEGQAVGLESHKKECVRRHSTLTKVGLGGIGALLSLAVGLAVRVLAS